MMNDKQNKLVATARLAGLWYLILAVAGMLGFLVFHPIIYISNDPAETLANITEQETIARSRLLFEFIIVISQALLAVWFYKLFRTIDNWAAWTLGVWGMTNSVSIMISAISMGSSLEIASSSVHSYEEKVLLIQVFGQLIANSWGVGSLFFGLWLIPMGYVIIKSKRMPVWLGRILIIGGIGYLLSTFINYTGFDSPYTEILVLPATVGEFWMIGYLLIYGIRVPTNKIEVVPDDIG